MSTAPSPPSAPVNIRQLCARFAQPHLGKAVWQLINTLPLFAAIWALMAWSIHADWNYFFTLLLALPAAGLYVRTFIIQHDCGHGSYFASAKANNIVGGVLGNQVGGGSGRTAATIAGAVIGGTVGYRHPGGRYYDAGGRTVRTSQQRCETRTEYRQNDRVLGYNVSYEYNGRVYRTQTDHHPGDRIRVAVQVAAAP